LLKVRSSFIANCTAVACLTTDTLGWQPKPIRGALSYSSEPIVAVSGEKLDRTHHGNLQQQDWLIFQMYIRVLRAHGIGLLEGYRLYEPEVHSETTFSSASKVVSLATTTMALRDLFTNSSFAKHHRAVKAAPREIIFNRTLILSSMLYAMSAVPLSKIEAQSSMSRL